MRTGVSRICTDITLDHSLHMASRNMYMYIYIHLNLYLYLYPYFFYRYMFNIYTYTYIIRIFTYIYICILYTYIYVHICIYACNVIYRHNLVRMWGYIYINQYIAILIHVFQTLFLWGNKSKHCLGIQWDVHVPEQSVSSFVGYFRWSPRSLGICGCKMVLYGCSAWKHGWWLLVTF